MKVVALITFIAGLGAIWATPPARSEPADLVKATLVADTTAVQPGQPFKLAVTFTIAPHWHIYWINPGDGGMATTVELRLPPGFTAAPLEYPTPRTFADAGGLVSFGYADEATLVATITPPVQLEAAPVKIVASANWLVCEKTCVAGDARMELSLPVGPAHPEKRDLFEQAAAKMPVPATASPAVAKVSQNMTFKAGGSEGEYRLIVEWRSPAPQDIEWFAPPTPALLFGSPKVESAGARTVIVVPVQRIPGQKLVPAELRSVLSHKAGNATLGVSVDVEVADLASGT